MSKKLISILLTVSILFSCFSMTVFAAESEINYSGAEEWRSSNTFSSAYNDVFDVSVYISPTCQALGLQMSLKFNSNNITYVSDSCKLNENIKYADVMVNTPTRTTILTNVLFEPKNGETFTQKTKVLSFSFCAKKASSDNVINYSVAEFYDASNDMKELDHSLVTVEVTKASSTELSSITVTPPTKTTYYQGESFNTAGMSVTAKYSDGTTKDVTTSATYSGFDTNKTGTQTITVSYGGKTATFTVTVVAVTLTKIEVTTKPTKTTYYVGDSLNTTGIKITGTYNNGTTNDVTSSAAYSGFDTNKTGTQTITVSCGEKTANFEITVLALSITEFTLTPPAKLTYFVGESLNRSGLKATVKYNSGKLLDVTDDIELSGFDSSSVGTKTVAASYGGKTATFNVTILEVTVESITVTPPTKTSYYIGENLDTSGMTISANYNNGTSENVTDKATVTGFDSTTNGEKTLTVEYGGKTATFKVTILAVTIESITVTTPTKTSYYIGENLDTSGMTVTANYNNGTSENVTDKATVTGFDSKINGEKTVMVEYGGKTATFKITILAVTVESITVTPPTKTSYYIGENLDTSGMTVTANYNNGTSENVTDKVTITGFDSTTNGEKTVMVEYGDKSGTFNVTIIEVEIDYITVNAPHKTSYFIGEKLDTEGLFVVAHYNDGSERDVTENAVITGFDSTTDGVKSVVVEVGGKIASFEVTVFSAQLEYIYVTDVTKEEYFVGEELDLDTFKIIAHYNNGEEIDVTSQVNVYNYNKDVSGTYCLEFKFGECSAWMYVRVIDIVPVALTLTPPMKTKYFVGEELDTTGMVVVAQYNDGTEKDVTSECSIYDYYSDYARICNVAVSYMDCVTRFDVEIVDVDYISVVSPPNKTNYFVGEELDLTGLSVSAYFTDGTQRDVTNEIIIGEFNSGWQHDFDMSVCYLSRYAYFHISIIEVAVTDLKVTPPNKLTYDCGEELDLTGFYVEAVYNNGTVKNVTSDTAVNYFDSSYPGTRELNIEYGGVRKSIFVNIIGVDRLIVTPPAKTTYFIGEELNLDGLKVIAVMTDETQRDVTSQISITDYDNTRFGECVVCVRYKDKIERFTVQIFDVTVSELILTPPNKTEYTQYDEVTTEGMKVVAKYNNGTEENVTDRVNITGLNTYNVGTYNVEVSYGGLTVSFEIKVNTPIGNELEITAPSQTEYFIGEDLNFDGFSAIMNYSDGHKEDVTNKVTILGYDCAVAGIVSVKVVYENYTSEFQVEVIRFLLGDVNFDGKISAMDSLLVQKFVSGRFSDPTPKQVKTMDVDFNGIISGSDSFQIQKYAAGIISKFERK